MPVMVLDHLAHHLAALARHFASAHRQLAGLAGVVGVLRHGGSEFLHRAGRLSPACWPVPRCAATGPGCLARSACWYPTRCGAAAGEQRRPAGAGWPPVPSSRNSTLRGPLAVTRNPPHREIARRGSPPPPASHKPASAAEVPWRRPARDQQADGTAPAGTKQRAPAPARMPRRARRTRRSASCAIRDGLRFRELVQDADHLVDPPCSNRAALAAGQKPVHQPTLVWMSSTHETLEASSGRRRKRPDMRPHGLGGGGRWAGPAAPSPARRRSAEGLAASSPRVLKRSELLRRMPSARGRAPGCS
jgi:hypothetical protein